MLIPCEECKKEISSQAAQCPNCGHPVSDEWVRRGSVSEPSKSGVLFSCIVVVVCAIFLWKIGGAFLSDEDDHPVVSQKAFTRAARDPDAVPFSRIWRGISYKFGLSRKLAQGMARKVRAEGHHCDSIHSYQKPEKGRYDLLCDNRAYVYHLTRKDGAWTTVTPDQDNPDRKNARSAAQKMESDRVPFSRIWRKISSKFGLSPELAQSMARKVRAEGHHCGDIHSYQNPEDGKYNLLCDGLAYVYHLTGKDGAWTTVKPDKDNPDRKNTRSAAQKPEASADPVRKTPKGREYRITEFALDSLDDKRILRTVDLMVDFVRDEGRKCDRVIVALLLPRASTASISCGEENQPSRDYNFRLAGDTLFFNRSTSD